MEPRLEGGAVGAEGMSSIPHVPPVAYAVPIGPAREGDLSAPATRLVPHPLALTLALATASGADPMAVLPEAVMPFPGLGEMSSATQSGIQRTLQGWWADGYQAAMMQQGEYNLFSSSNILLD